MFKHHVNALEMNLVSYPILDTHFIFKCVYGHFRGYKSYKKGFIMNINKNNMFIITGVLVYEPYIKLNKDNSKHVTITVKPNDSDVHIMLSGLISKNIKGLGPYQYLKKNQQVQILYSLKTININNNIELVNQIDYIQFSSVINTDKDIIKKIVYDNVKQQKNDNAKPLLDLSEYDTQELMKKLYEIAF